MKAKRTAAEKATDPKDKRTRPPETPGDPTGEAEITRPDPPRSKVYPYDEAVQLARERKIRLPVQTDQGVLCDYPPRALD